MGEALSTFDLLENPPYRSCDLEIRLCPGAEPVVCARARGFGERLRGLLGTGRDCLEGGVLLIERCPSVHTFGMAYDIDVALLNAYGVVLASWRAVPPGRVRACRHAAAALERAASPDPWPSPGTVPQFIVGRVL